MNIRIIFKIMAVSLILLLINTTHVSAQSNSYLETVYSAYSSQNASEAEELEAIKDAIYSGYGIRIVDDTNYALWKKDELQTIQELLETMPKSFTSYTKAIVLEPTSLQYEIKYNGFGNEEGTIYVGGGARNPSPLYLRRYQSLYEGGYPTSDWMKYRLKSMIVRGMTYPFIQANIDLMGAYANIVTLARVGGEKFYTKLFSPGAESNMVVGPSKTHNWVDLAFAVDQYCTNSANLKSLNETRYDFVKTYVMDGAGVRGWQNTQLITTDTANLEYEGDDDDPGDNDNPGDNDDPGDNDNPGGDTEPVEDRPAPEIPDGDYLPLVTDVDTGTATVSIPAEQKTMPAGMKTAIVELFSRLPKYFSTCTQAIAYVPSTDTEVAFSSESYIFVTQNSWFMPSFSDLTEAMQKERFKQYLLREMTSRFLYYHGSVVASWKEEFDPAMSNFDAYTDLQQAVIAYYHSPNYFKTLNPDRYSFIRNYLMKGIEY